MRSQVTAVDAAQDTSGEVYGATDWAAKREFLRDVALRNAMAKRAAGVPTYSVPEAAALLSISQEYLYRLIQGGGFPAVRMRLSGAQGRYVVPAKAVEQLLNEATNAAASVEVADWTAGWAGGVAGGAR
jgi:excisionase family DNA binding protein